ncbi:hypothetical protein OH76DRAFT_446161 [Lentinus brumalis]|uniref:Secreted protein n=1 Tax=Lentinus brumalis TaxID=2498619 RepID=A0A371DCY8_9APHY|nr:hypothetical protein OH76DRAFT_446161 [Polyporus brumalis]
MLRLAVWFARWTTLTYATIALTSGPTGHLILRLLQTSAFSVGEQVCFPFAPHGVCVCALAHKGVVAASATASPLFTEVRISMSKDRTVHDMPVMPNT